MSDRMIGMDEKGDEQPRDGVITPEVFDAEGDGEFVGLEDSELETRRKLVLSLRLRRLTQLQIAEALQKDPSGRWKNINQSVVSKDLKWIRKNWRDQYGAKSSIDPAELVGETLAFYRNVSEMAMRDYHALDKSESKSRNACMRTALGAESMRVNLLQDMGLIDRRPVEVTARLRADAVRQALRAEGLLITEGAAMLNEDEVRTQEDEIEKWLRGER